jgi:hypothetical protein
MPSKRPRKAFEAAVTPWEIRAFKDKPDVQKLLRGEFYNPKDLNRDYDSAAYWQACRDYVVGFVERSGKFPGDDFLTPRYFQMDLVELLVPAEVSEDPRHAKDFIERLLTVAAKMPRKEAHKFVEDVVDECLFANGFFEHLQAMGAGIQYVTPHKMSAFLIQQMCDHVAELRAAPKPAVDAVPAAQKE